MTNTFWPLAFSVVWGGAKNESAVWWWGNTPCIPCLTAFGFSPRVWFNRWSGTYFIFATSPARHKQQWIASLAKSCGTFFLYLTSLLLQAKQDFQQRSKYHSVVMNLILHFSKCFLDDLDGLCNYSQNHWHLPFGMQTAYCTEIWEKLLEVLIVARVKSWQCARSPFFGMVLGPCMEIFAFPL